MITAIVLSKNEENNIVDCIDSLSFCDEIIVIDDNSEDRTRDAAKEKKVKVVQHTLQDNFSDQRNYALTLASNPWVLFIDADERVSSSLSNEIKRAIEDTEVNGYYIPRVDELFGTVLKHGDTSSQKFLRLGKRDEGKWIGLVHETWRMRGKTKTLQNPIIHKPHQTITEFLQEVNYYTTLRANELYKKGVKSSLGSIILHTKGKFLYLYFIKLGFLDGIPGLIHAHMMAFHSFLVRGKLYLLVKRNDKN